MLIDKLLETKIKVYAFVGPSGTGKSYRAQMVASEYNEFLWRIYGGKSSNY